MKVSDILNNILGKMKSESFSCKENLNLGSLSANFYAGKKVWWYIIWPNFIHYYMFEVPISNINLQYILGLHALARSYTDRFKNKRSRWLRWMIPITVTIAVSENGFSEDVIHEIENKKQRCQMGDINTIILVDALKKQIHHLKKTGFIARAPLEKINKYTTELFSKIVQNNL